MNITNIVVTTTAKEKTENAIYEIEYHTTNQKLTRVNFSIYEEAVENSEYASYIGQIVYDNSTFTCHLTSTTSLSAHFSDVEEFMKRINNSLK